MTDGPSGFARALEPAGLAELQARLDDGAYRVDVPEAAALLTVAWLVRAGDLDAAEALVAEITPFADRLRFTPAPGLARDCGTVWRTNVGQVRDTLARRAPDVRVEAMRATLTVWNPYADELLALWLDSAVDGRVGAKLDDAWRVRATALVDRYRQLSAAHPPPRKHRDPKENATVLRTCAATAAAGGRLAPRELRRLEHAVSSMVARRGRPGSPEHVALRTDQAGNAALPSFPAFARLLLARLDGLPGDRGVDRVDELLAPVPEGALNVPEGMPEGAVKLPEGVLRAPAGFEVPAVLRRVVRRALAGTPEELLDAGVVPSAEVLAAFAPAMAATTVAAAYRDGALRTLVAQNYLAFRARRSLLLVDLARQARFEELPWVRAVAGHRAGPRSGPDGGVTARRLGGLLLTAFPGTLAPNPVVRELAQLTPHLPWVEELAADIFQGRFSPKFTAAAQLAGELLDGGLYARYYGVDYATITDTTSFTQRCRDHADQRDRNTVAAAGSVIEHAQVLTTHNLATLVHANVDVDWEAAAQGAFRHAVRLAPALRGPHVLRTVKDIAYAWRQMVFFLSLTGSPESLVAGWWSRTPAVLHAPLAGLAHVVIGGEFDAAGRGGRGWRLLGWTAGRHRLTTQGWNV